MSKEFTPLSLLSQLMNPKPSVDVSYSFNLEPVQIITFACKLVKSRLIGEAPILEYVNYHNTWTQLPPEDIDRIISDHILLAINAPRRLDASRSFLGVYIKSYSPISHHLPASYLWLTDINARTGINRGDGKPVEREDGSVKMTQIPDQHDNNSHLYIRQRRK